MSTAPAVVTLHVYGVSPVVGATRAFLRMGIDRRPLRKIPGLRFAKLLGTGAGRTFDARDADPSHWAVLSVWDDLAGPDRFEASSVAVGWDSICEERARFAMRPLMSRGTWAGEQPFGSEVPSRWDGPVAAITRGKIRPSRWREFWTSAAHVSADLRTGSAPRLSFGIGEAPVGLQGTFSVWESNRDLTQFAHRRDPHLEVMKRTVERDWYVEELFARFALTGATGTYRHIPVTTNGASSDPHLG